MRLLLDTHIFLWYVSGDPALPARFRDAIRDPANEIYLSVASVWEAAIKYALGKLPLPADAAVYLPNQREAHQITSLAIDEAAMVHLTALPPLHRDPFDRMLVAQTLQHNMTLLAVDHAIRAYTVPLLRSS